MESSGFICEELAGVFDWGCSILPTYLILYIYFTYLFIYYEEKPN